MASSRWLTGRESHFQQVEHVTYEGNGLACNFLDFTTLSLLEVNYLKIWCRVKVVTCFSQCFHFYTAWHKIPWTWSFCCWTLCVDVCSVRIFIFCSHHMTVWSYFVKCKTATWQPHHWDHRHSYRFDIKQYSVHKRKDKNSTFTWLLAWEASCHTVMMRKLQILQYVVC